MDDGGMERTGIGRRAALGLMAATGAGAALGGFPAGATPGRIVASHLQAAFSDPEAARAVGRVYLGRYPEEADADTVLARLCSDDADATGVLFGADTAGVRNWLKARCRADFAAGRTADVSGWRLARSEARVMALLALV